MVGRAQQAWLLACKTRSAHVSLAAGGCAMHDCDHAAAGDCLCVIAMLLLLPLVLVLVFKLHLHVYLSVYLFLYADDLDSEEEEEERLAAAEAAQEAPLDQALPGEGGLACQPSFRQHRGHFLC
jgi:hypothetical protein